MAKPVKARQVKNDFLNGKLSYDAAMFNLYIKLSFAKWHECYKYLFYI